MVSLLCPRQMENPRAYFMDRGFARECDNMLKPKMPTFSTMPEKLGLEVRKPLRIARGDRGPASKRWTLGWAVILVTGICLATDAARGEDSWPQWRGPEGQGHATARDLPEKWSESENVRWRTSLPGRGWSSPVVQRDEIWMTTAIEIPLEAEERERRILAAGGNQPLSVAGAVSLRALCVDRTSGNLKHDIELILYHDPDPVHTLNSYASPSPVLEKGRLYAHFGRHGTACLDTVSGEVVWTNLDLKVNHENGPGSTPVLHGDHLIIHYDGSDYQFIVGLDKRTGEVDWKTDRSGELNENPQLKKAYGTPLVLELNGRVQVLSPGADWLYGYDPATGSELWKLSYGALGFSIVPRPVFGQEMLFLSTSFVQPEMLAIELEGVEAPRIAWRVARQAPQMPSPLLVGDELYWVSDRGIATCVDARTGQVHWSERLGGNFSSSPWFADGKIYVGNREGTTYVLSPGREFRLLAENVLEGQIMATPVALENSIYIRTDEALYRIESSR